MPSKSIERTSVARKSSRKFDLCDATNAVFGVSGSTSMHRRPSVAPIDASTSASIAIRGPILKDARKAGLFRYWSFAMSPAAMHARAPVDGIASSSTSVAEKKMRKVVDTKKMRG